MISAPGGRVLVLDASVIVAYARREPGAALVAERLRDSDRVLVSAVNWSEAAAKLIEVGPSPALARRTLEGFAADVVSFTEVDADAAAALAQLGRPLGLSLGDRACLALAQRAGATALTADRSWAELETGITIESIR